MRLQKERLRFHSVVVGLSSILSLCAAGASQCAAAASPLSAGDVVDSWSNSAGVASGSFDSSMAAPGMTPTDLGKEGNSDQGCQGVANHSAVMSSGVEVQTQLDFRTHHQRPLSLVRTYNSSNPTKGLFGTYWSSNFDQHLGFWHPGSTAMCSAAPGSTNTLCGASSSAVTAVTLVRPDGGQVTYQQSGTSSTYVNASPDSNDSFVHNGDGSWSQKGVDGSLTQFNSYGLLASTADATGIGWTLSYSSNYLQSATHSNGQNVQFAWHPVSHQVTQVTDPAGNLWKYSYTAYDGTGMLNGVTAPSTDSRTYYYESPTFPAALTGIGIDGDRYSTYSYNKDGTLASSGLDDGSYEGLTFTYSKTSTTRTTTVTNAAGASTTNTYAVLNGTSQLSSASQMLVTNCTSKQGTVNYDGNGHPKSSVDGNGNTTNYTFSTNGLLKQVVTGISGTPGVNAGQTRTTNYTYDSENRVSTINTLDDGNNPITGVTYAYYATSAGPLNRLKSIKVQNLSANGTANQTQITNYSYQFYANGIASQITVSGPLAGPTGYVVMNYSAAGNLTSQADALGNTTTYTAYTGLGVPQTVTDANGYVQKYTFDGNARIATVTRTLDGVAATTSYSYDGLDDVTYIQYPDGGKVYQYFTSAGQLGAVQTELSTNLSSCGSGCISGTTTWTSLQYNNLGLLTGVNVSTEAEVGSSNPPPPICNPTCPNLATNPITPGGTGTFYKHGWNYDSLGRLSTETDASGQALWTYTYDGASNVQTAMDNTNKTWTYTYTANNQVETIKDPQGKTTTLTYDNAGHPSSVTDGRGLLTEYYFDGFGHLTTLNSADTGVTTYSYDTLGRIAQMQRADGSLTTYHFDSLNRPTSIVAGSLTNTYTYDNCTNGIGRLCSVTDSSGSTSYTYRLNGQINGQTSVINGTSYATAWGYDNRERPVTVTYPGGNKVTYAYNTQSQPTAVTATFGGSTKTVLGSIIYSVNNMGPMSSATSGDGSVTSYGYNSDFALNSLSAPGMSYSYGFDADDRVSSITDQNSAANSEILGYDSLSRLKTVTSSGLGNQSFALDDSGNRTSATWGGITDTFTPDTYSNRINSISGSRARSYSFDGLGNTTGISGWQNISPIKYDAFKRLSSLQTSAGTTTYTYNALNQRVRKSGPSGNSNFIYGPDGTLLQDTASGSQYIWMAGQPIGVIRGGSLYFIHNDHLGRPQTVTNSSKTIVWQATNYPFDRTVTVNTFGGLNLGLPGQYYDSESGFWYNGARYYDSTTGRYLQSDPMGLAGGSLSTYAYAAGNPIRFVDPAGLEIDMGDVTGAVTQGGSILNAGYFAYNFAQGVSGLGLVSGAEYAFLCVGATTFSGMLVVVGTLVITAYSGYQLYTYITYTKVPQWFPSKPQQTQLHPKQNSQTPPSNNQSSDRNDGGFENGGSAISGSEWSEPGALGSGNAWGWICTSIPDKGVGEKCVLKLN